MPITDKSVPDILISVAEIPKPNNASPFKEDISDILSIAIGYVRISFALGLNAIKLTLALLNVIFLSCFTYSVINQFVTPTLSGIGISSWRFLFLQGKTTQMNNRESYD
ncbi:hypothetical protein [Xenorhabdus szentirmaii]|uniref:Amino acid transport protein n=2 Tax=Xenorhabdus szentirmaii TaxID=290112 RepID=W1IY46_9GAMM|nr:MULTISPECIES: hypothetical protein [Xenorhabdus]MBD2780161.1 hypothetical protein [Xenorhabdus sp. 38]MBD2802090.1 hypothetical protein [Xenorhabdus sp. M]MBD2806475.1 hypothetical protein [Xenorhabdus sp. ZM]PHM31578.1 membrane protein [Xenorhabdus szentirmaii DSM 16338]PHM42039.1 membrane protein [Xenorhabdus szentirmaii]